MVVDTLCQMASTSFKMGIYQGLFCPRSVGVVMETVLSNFIFKSGVCRGQFCCRSVSPDVIFCG